MKHTIPAIVIILFSTLLLVACSSTLNTQFTCQQKTKHFKGCPSLTKVDSQIDAGLWPPPEKTPAITNPPAPILSAHYAPTDNDVTHSNTVSRQRETVNTIWIAPFEDTQGDYHHEQLIDVIVNPGTWQPQPAREDETLD